MEHALAVATLGVELNAIVEEEQPGFIAWMADVDKGSMLFIDSTGIDVEVISKQEVNGSLLTAIGGLGKGDAGFGIVDRVVSGLHECVGNVCVSPAQSQRQSGHERLPAWIRFGSDVCTGVEEIIYDFPAAKEGGPMKWRQGEATVWVVDANRIRLTRVVAQEIEDAIALSEGTGIENIEWIVVRAEQLDYRVMIVPGSNVDRFLRERTGAAIPTNALRVGVAVEERAHQVRATMPGGEPERTPRTPELNECRHPRKNLQGILGAVSLHGSGKSGHCRFDRLVGHVRLLSRSSREAHAVDVGRFSGKALHQRRRSQQMRLNEMA